MILAKYVLILTLFGSEGQHSQSNPAITSISGFTSSYSCTTAGNAWLRNIKRTGGYGQALCVEVK